MNNSYYHTKESVDEYTKAAEGFNGKHLIEQLKKHLPSKSTLLEIGSGPGADFKLLKKGYSAIGSDFSAEFLKRLKKKFPEDEFYQLDAASLEINTPFNGIYSNKVLQHLSDEELKKSVQRQAEILTEGGVICHSLWKGIGEEYFKGMRVNYQTEDTLRLFFGAFFEPIQIDSYAEFEDGDSLMMIAKKK